MCKNEYIKMLMEDNETEAQPKKELHEAVIECVIEALSQSPDNVEIDPSIGLDALFQLIQDNRGGSSCVSPFKASELFAERFGVKYARPFDTLKAKLCGAELNKKSVRKIDLDDL